MLGIGVKAELLMADENSIVYKYSSYNDNFKKYSDWNLADGLIEIEKSCLDNHLLYSNLKAGLVKIENTVNCWNVNTDGYDTMALQCLQRIFKEYETDNHLPEKVNINY